MEDSKLLLYLVLGAIYVISKLLKKKKPAESTAEDFEEEASKPTGPTFEELLKEMTAGKEQPKTEEAPYQPQSESFTEQKATSPYIKPVEPQVTHVETNIDEELEDIQSRDSRNDLIREKPTYERSRKYKIQEEDDSNVAADIMDLLSDANGAKRVVIAQEILKRKY